MGNSVLFCALPDLGAATNRTIEASRGASNPRLQDNKPKIGPMYSFVKLGTEG